MSLFLIFTGLSIALVSIAWWLLNIDAFLLILLHPVFWAFTMLAVAGVIKVEEHEDAGP